jgi:hypothetical protein
MNGVLHIEIAVYFRYWHIIYLLVRTFGASASVMIAMAASRKIFTHIH